MSRCVSSLATHTGSSCLRVLAVLTSYIGDIPEHWQHVRLWQCMGQCGANRHPCQPIQQISSVAGGGNECECDLLTRGLDEEWPPNTFFLCSVYKGNHQWFIRKCTVPTINTVHIRILLKLAVLESNLKAIFGYKGGLHVAFQVAVSKSYSKVELLDLTQTQVLWLQWQFKIIHSSLSSSQEPSQSLLSLKFVT